MLLIDKYAYMNGVRHIHPLEKMVFALSFLLFSLSVRDILISLITLSLMSFSIIFIAKIPWKYYMKLLLLPLFFLLFGCLAILISFASIHTLISDSLWHMEWGAWQIYISMSNVVQVILLVVVSLGSVSCLYFLILTTPMTEILYIFQKWRIPVLLLEMIHFTYRFIFVMLETIFKMYHSQAVRLGYGSFRTSIRSLGLLLSTLFLKTMQQSRWVYQAMEARGYEGEMVFMKESYTLSISRFSFIIFAMGVMGTVYIGLGGSKW